MIMLAFLKSDSAPKLKNAPAPIVCKSASSDGRSRALDSAAIFFNSASSGRAPLASIADSSMQLA